MQLTRLELYERVCDRPLSKIAPELGISGTALAAICKRYQVPYPGSGYWTRKSLGLPAEPPTLPTASEETIEITPSVGKASIAPAGKAGPTGLAQAFRMCMGELRDYLMSIIGDDTRKGGKTAPAKA